MQIQDLFEVGPAINRIVWRKRQNDPVKKQYEKQPILTDRKRIEVKQTDAK